MKKKEECKTECFDEMEYEYWLAAIPHLSNRKKYLLRKHMKSAACVYYIEETELLRMQFLSEKDRRTVMEAKRQNDLRERLEKMQEKGIRFLSCFDSDYPSRLLELSDYPYALYVKGSLPEETSRKAAVVGARNCTPYGEKYAIEFGKALAKAGVEVISGLARGIDGMGQRGALLGGGKTFAVLGSGTDVCYPREHAGLYEDIVEQGGGILSEFSPGTPPLPQNFPARNRIISGLADAVLIMEARERSGSLITADAALEQGRDVYALPGPVNSPLSAGCNRLIQQGAGILLSPENFLEEWGMAVPDLSGQTEKNKKVLERTENLVYSCLGLYPKNVDQIIRETEMSAKDIVALLVSLQLKGYIREISKNHYVRL